MINVHDGYVFHRFISLFGCYKNDLRVKLPYPTTFPDPTRRYYLLPHSTRFSALDSNLGVAHPPYPEVIYLNIGQSNLNDTMGTADLRDLISEVGQL